jgi:hypothetical protein
MNNYLGYYPCLIFKTRYGGVYEDGLWACIAYHEEIPSEAIDDDVTCSMWWYSSQSDFVGRGSTPNEAYEDMLNRYKEYIGTINEDSDKNPYKSNTYSTSKTYYLKNEPIQYPKA